MSNIIQDKNLICLLSHYTHQSHHFFVCDMVLSASQIPPSQRPSQWPSVFRRTFPRHLVSLSGSTSTRPTAYRALDHLELGSAWEHLGPALLGNVVDGESDPRSSQTPRRAILAIPTTTHNNLQIPAGGCAFLKNAHCFPSVSVWQYVPALVRYLLGHFAVEVVSDIDFLPCDTLLCDATSAAASSPKWN